MTINASAYFETVIYKMDSKLRDQFFSENLPFLLYGHISISTLIECCNRFSNFGFVGVKSVCVYMCTCMHLCVCLWGEKFKSAPCELPLAMYIFNPLDAK